MRQHAILILDDNTADYNDLLLQLRPFGLTEEDFYRCIDKGQLSEPAARAFAPTCIFVNADIEGSGSTLETYLYVQNLFPTIPVILLSNESDEHVVEQCIQLGAESLFLKRSLNNNQLYRVITFSRERSQVKQELMRLKAEYQDMFDQNPVPMFLVEVATSKFLAANKAALKKYEYSIGELLEMSFADISDNSRTAGNICISSRINCDASFTCHYKRSGEMLCVEIQESPITYNNIDATLITISDVTGEVLALQEEKRARQRLDAIFNGTNDSILLTNDEGKYIQVNKAACKALGYSEAEFLSLSVTDLVVRKLDEAKYQELWSEFQGTGTMSGIIELRKKDGATIICSYNASANVLPGLHLSILNDVTRQEHNRRKIENQAKRIENILSSISDSFFAVDQNWIIQYWNTAAEKLLGVSKEEIVGKCLWDYFEGLADMEMHKKYHEAMQEKVAVHFEDYYPAIDKWADISAYPTEEGLAIYFRDITVKKRQELQILKARNNNDALINSSKDLIWSIDRNKKLVSCNKAFCRRIEKTVGITPAEGFQMPAEDLHDTEKFKEWDNYYTRALQGEAFKAEETFVDRNTGQIKKAEITFHPIYGVDTNTIEGIACYSHDITTRILQQNLIEAQNNKLKENEAHLERLTGDLKKVMDSSLDIICSLDVDGKFVQVSEASRYVLGYAPEELIGHCSRQHLEPSYAAITRKVADAIMAGENHTNFQNVYIHKDGRQVPISWSARWDADEQIMFCVARDASVLVEAEKLKAESEQRFTALVQKGTDMVGIIDEVGNYKYLSQNVKEILGYDAEELMKVNALSNIHPEDMERALQELQKVSQLAETKLAAFRYKNAAGEWKWIETIACNELNNPAINGIVINSRDITERKQIEDEREMMIKELLKSNADLKQFSFITSHNLRAPLSNIIGILNILDYDSLDAYNKEMLSMLDKSTRQLGQTIDDLAKILIIKNNVNVEVSVIDLEETIDKVNRIFVNTLNDVCAKTVNNFGVKEITFNKTYFESIVVNLVSNAVKYRSPKRNLCINISTYIDYKGDTILKFTDNGLGIDVERNRNRIFGLYQRFHDHTEGHGLGLFIIKSQIVALGGKIEIDSAVDQGTTFTITFKNQPAALEKRTVSQGLVSSEW